MTVGNMYLKNTAIGLNTTHRGVITGNPHNVKEFDTTAYFNAEVDNGNSGAADTVDWTAGNKQKSTMTDNCTYTFTPEPAGPCNLMLKLVQDGTGSRLATWPADVKWAGGGAPTLTTSINAVDLMSFYYDGTDFHGSSLLDMQ